MSSSLPYSSRNKLLDNKSIRIAQNFTKKIINVFKNIKRNAIQKATVTRTFKILNKII